MRSVVVALALISAAPARPASRAEPAAAPAAQGLVAALVRNAWYWQARGREDKALEAWGRVLAADPDHGEALAAAGGLEARAGRDQPAREKLARLARVNPGHPDLPVLRRQVELGPRFLAGLAEARRLAHDGKTADAVARYRALFGGAAPPGDLALEYFETVAGTKGGWGEAREGLDRLARRAPAEPRFRLSLARLLTYRDDTRREGVRALATLARTPAVAKDAVAAWRRALLWLPGTAEDAELVRAYLRAHPDDAEVGRRLEVDRTTGAIKSGFAALDRGDLPEAERRFAAAGDVPDARLGRAIVLQRRAAEAQRAEDFTRARELLRAARQLAPGRPDLWQEPLQAATFWGVLREARAARDRGRVELARGKLLEALDVAPDRERWRASLALGDLLRDEGRLREAEARYRDVLASAPDQPDALRALTGLLVKTGRWEEARPLNDRLARVARRDAVRPEWLASEEARARATRLRAAGDLAAARTALEEARRADPENAWVLHDLGSVLLEQGSVAEAGPVVEELVRRQPALPAAQVLHARLLDARGDRAGALAVLQGLRPPTDDPAAVTLRRRLEVEVRVPALLQAAAAGPDGRAAAVRELAGIERGSAGDPQLAAPVALAWLKLGEPDRALAVVRATGARAPQARLELASAFLDAGDDARFEAVLGGLDRDPSLAPGERRWLSELRVARAIRVADRSRAAGDDALAVASLEPALREHPDDPRLLDALGRASARRDPRRARAAFERALAVAPDDPEARRGAVEAALAADDVEGARRLADEGTRRHPGSAAAHLLAGRAAARAGDDASASEALERARALADRPPALASASSAPVAEGGARRASLDPAGPDGDPAAIRADVSREIAALRARHRPALDLDLEARFRSGEYGLGRMTEVRGTARAAVPLRFAGRLTLRVTEVQLDAGSPSADIAPRLGTGGALAGDALARLQATGTELALGYEQGWFAATVGTTPLGFPIWSVVGNVRLRKAFGPLELGAEGGRRSVDESVLSYAGMRDPATGQYWGGVVADGGRVDLSLGGAPGRVYAYAGGDRLVGFHVSENRRLLAGGGATVRVASARGSQVTIGVNALGLAYDRDRSFFTFGHGGYFSPQRFLHVGVPLGWSGNRGVRWEIVAEPAWHVFEQQQSLVLPLDPSSDATNPAQRTRGAAFDGRAQVALPLRRGFEAALRFGYQAAPEFSDVRAAFVIGWSPR